MSVVLGWAVFGVVGMTVNIWRQTVEARRLEKLVTNSLEVNLAELEQLDSMRLQPSIGADTLDDVHDGRK